MIYQRYIKPAADCILAATGIVLLSPCLVILGIAIALRMGWPVLFRQPRIGLLDRSFAFHKFRTMTDQRDAAGNLLPDEQRLTALGSFLRASSLDEFPQLWNVVKGDMSLIGPRPLLPEYLPRYSIEQRRRHSVKPGITGWAQVNGRNGISWEEKFRYDVWYVDNCSLSIDIKILVMTLASVLHRRGISQPGHATAAPFMGSPTDAAHEGKSPSAVGS
jgi:lipopolysaccharide/colanic/teichoic acid biosynthesis glycosyltransferase